MIRNIALFLSAAIVGALLSGARRADAKFTRVHGVGCSSPNSSLYMGNYGRQGNSYCAIPDTDYLHHANVRQIFVDIQSGTAGSDFASACVLSFSGNNVYCGSYARSTTTGYQALQPSLSAWQNANYYWWYPVVAVQMNSSSILTGVGVDGI
jgi:hypothetical protein